MTVFKNKRLSWLPYIATAILLYVIGFSFLWIAGEDHHILFGMGILTYTLGLRYAFDTDHIVAIDSTVRKLLQQRKGPSGVGFYFLIGHSSVVFLVAVFSGVSIKWTKDGLPYFQDTGGTIGTLVSGFFLVLIGVLNLVILISLINLFAKLRHGHIEEAEVDALPGSRGLASRFVGPYFRLITRNWHALPLDFLFGLGFGTASEVALLALSSGVPQQAISFVRILSSPILFASGISLLDALNGVVMKYTYNWAFFDPIRKVYYSIAITAISIMAALVIGTIELLQIPADKLDLHDAFWTFIGSTEFDYLGYILVVLFLTTWLISNLVWKFGRIEHKRSR